MKKLVLVIGLIAVAAAAAVPVDAAEGEFGGATTPVDVVVQGRGFGHGRGMGQFGALGYAVDHSWTYDRILDHFYSNTMSGQPGCERAVLRTSHSGEWPRPDRAVRLGLHRW